MDNPYLERRYLVSFESRRLPHIFTDVLVVGGGAAGLRAAIEAANHGQVILAAKGDLHDSNTYYAQGGMAAVLDSADSAESHVADTISAAAGLGDEKVIRHVVAAAPAHVGQMQEWGVEAGKEGYGLARSLCGVVSALHETGQIKPAKVPIKTYTEKSLKAQERMRKMLDDDRLDEINRPERDRAYDRDSWMTS